ASRLRPGGRWSLEDTLPGLGLHGHKRGAKRLRDLRSPRRKDSRVAGVAGPAGCVRAGSRPRGNQGRGPGDLQGGQAVSRGELLRRVLAFSGDLDQRRRGGRARSAGVYRGPRAM
ncbi:MAG: hypothetical protein AVDCRST_MAG05-2914, partial [uncultured Rubrobacteraceae bacterium]